MQLRWALWAMAIGSSKESPPGKKASHPSSSSQTKKKTEEDPSRKSGGNVSSSRRSLFRKSSSTAEEDTTDDQQEASEEEEEEEEEEQSLRWAADALLPRLRDLEAGLLDRAVSGLWSRALDAVRAGAKEEEQQQRRPSSTSGGRESSSSSSHLERRAEEAEEAAGRWVDVLRSAARDAASSARASVPEPHAALFVVRSLGALLDKVDGLLCEAATGVKETEGERERERKEEKSNKATTFPILPASFLPFDPRYPLTFTSGVGIKLAVGRIGLWAADARVVSSSSSSTSAASAAADALNGAEGDGDETGNGNGNPSSSCSSILELPRLFPRLRAVADLLMMPKEALADASARLDVLPHLSLRSICGALARFKPDDHAPDPLPPGLLDVLREQAEDEEEEEEEEEEEDEREEEAGKKSKSPEALQLRAALAPVPERAMLARGLVPEPLSLEQSPESEDELDELEQAVGGGAEGDSVGLRFDLLRELWSSAR